MFSMGKGLRMTEEENPDRHVPMGFRAEWDVRMPDPLLRFRKGLALAIADLR